MSNSVKANKEQREELISLASRIPFDDRPNVSVSIKHISPVLLKDHLRKIDSRLLEWVDTRDTEEVLAQMELLSGPPEFRHPRNVALMMFTDDPQKYFPQSKVDIVSFPNGAGDHEFIEIPSVVGPIPLQITQTLSYLKTNVLKEKIKKIRGQAESVRIANYPYQALEEIIANALYHRDYQTREPVEVRIYPEEIVILNYGGPDRSIKESAFKTGKILPRRYRNRRLGDFLKELDLTEGKTTGIPMIKRALEKNGSPEAQFETDYDRSFFQVTLRIHPEFIDEGDIVKSINRKDYSISEEVNGNKNEGANEGETGNVAFKKEVKEEAEGKGIANEGAKEERSEGANKGDDANKAFTRGLKEEAEEKDIANEGAKGKEKIDSSIYRGLIEREVKDSASRTIDKLVRVLKAIAENEYQRVPDYSRITGIPAKSVERYVRTLKNGGFIDFSESGTKIGGYFLTEKLMKMLEINANPEE